MIKNIINTIKEYFIITLGVILVSFGIQYFFAPNEIAGGGLSGMALIINNYIPQLSMGTIVFIGNLILFILAFILIGGDFGFKTIYASFMMSVVMDFMGEVLNSYALTENLVLAVIFGTLVCSIGIALTFANNASTGGTDIIAKILNKKSTINIGIALLLVDLFVVVCGGFTFGLGKGIYSLISVVGNGLLIDFLIAKIEKNRENKSSKLEVQSAQLN